MRSQLEAMYYTPLKKKNNACAIVILGQDHISVISQDSEAAVGRTHCDTGKDFPWQATLADNCCTGALALLLCTIM